jgi:hypothetical protein
MKKRIAIANFGLMLAVLFAMLFQSLHSFEHIAAEFTEEHCYHEYGATKTEITHQHHKADHCIICDFSFSNFIPAEAFAFRPVFFQQQIPYFATVPEVPFSFSGSVYSLRGPPPTIV